MSRTGRVRRRAQLVIGAFVVVLAAVAPMNLLGVGATTEGAAGRAASSALAGAGSADACREQTDSVRRLYLAYFGRSPDRGGFDFWAERYQTGQGLANISEFFATSSAEFEELYGELSDTDFVSTLYQSVLEREADAGGLAFWADRLDAGVRRGTVMLSFSESAEFVAETRTAVPVAGYLRWFPAGTTWSCGEGSGAAEIAPQSRFVDVTLRNPSASSEPARINVVAVDGSVTHSVDVKVGAGLVRSVANIPVEGAARVAVLVGDQLKASGFPQQNSPHLTFVSTPSALVHSITQYGQALPEDRPGWVPEGIPIVEPDPAGPTIEPPPTTAPPTTAPPTTAPPTTTDATDPPRVEREITGQGKVSANTTFTGFGAELAVDGDPGTSWFSTGPGQGDSIFTWSGPRVDVSRIVVIGNAENNNAEFRTGFGFESMRVEVLDRGTVVFSQEVSMAGTPDRPPAVNVGGILGDSIRLTLAGHESPECGGFAELSVFALA